MWYRVMWCNLRSKGTGRNDGPSYRRLVFTQFPPFYQSKLIQDSHQRQKHLRSYKNSLLTTRSSYWTHSLSIVLLEGVNQSMFFFKAQNVDLSYTSRSSASCSFSCASCSTHCSARRSFWRSRSILCSSSCVSRPIKISKIAIPLPPSQTSPFPIPLPLLPLLPQPHPHLLHLQLFPLLSFHLHLLRPLPFRRLQCLAQRGAQRLALGAFAAERGLHLPGGNYGKMMGFFRKFSNQKVEYDGIWTYLHIGCF